MMRREPLSNATSGGDVPAVLVVGNGWYGGGAEARLAQLVPRLFSGCVDVALLAGEGPPAPLCRGNVYCLGWRSRLSYPRLVAGLRRILRRRRYDVVIAFGLFPIALASLAMRGMSVRPRFIVSEITRPDAAGDAGNALRGWVYRRLRRTLYRSGDLITANSLDGLAETCRLVDADAASGIRLPNIVDIERVHQDAGGSHAMSLPFERYVISVGRLIAMKRLDTVLEAIARTRSCGLVIVGDGERRDALMAQVRALGVQDIVLFTGRLDNPLPLVRRASALVLASEYEGFSNAVLEAMFCDVPVITSLCSSDARDMCEQGAALGFAVADAAGLAGHIMAVIDDDALRQRLIQRAREYRAPHGADRAVPYYEDVIRRVAGFTRASP